MRKGVHCLALPAALVLCHCGGSGAQPGAGNGAAGAGGGGDAGGSAGTAQVAFMLGADISSVPEIVRGGATFVDTDGAQKSLLDLLKNHGFNFIRLRTFVNPAALYGYANPTGDPQYQRAEPFCDKDHTVAFAQEIKAAGMGLLLDFHYSDNWADPGKQIIPSSWRGVSSLDDLASLTKSYTTDVVSALVNAGARPDLVQVGNEITPGVLIQVPAANPNPDQWGNITTVTNGVNGSVANWTDLGTLLKAGTDGVKAVDPSIRIMLHVENTKTPAAALYWVSSAREQGVSFDVLGLSCYTAYQGQPSVWQDTFSQLAAAQPDLSFAIAEYNPDRTQANQIMHDLPDGRGLGTFFWEPTQGGAWGASLFTVSGTTYTALAPDFSEFDTIRTSVGL